MTTSILYLGPRDESMVSWSSYLTDSDFHIAQLNSMQVFMQYRTSSFAQGISNVLAGAAYFPDSRPPALILLSDRIEGWSTVAALDALAKCRDCPPVLVLGSGSDAIERIVCLELGADDYIDMPCNPRELLSRLRNVLRYRPQSPQAQVQQGGIFRFGEFALDLVRRELHRGVTPVALQSSAMSLLQLFAGQPMKVLNRSVLIGAMQHRGSHHNERSLDVLVCRLRNVIESQASRPRFIQTVRGHGYVFNPDGNDGQEKTAAHQEGAFAEPRTPEPATREAGAREARTATLSGRFFPAQYRASEDPAGRSPALR